MAIQARLQYTGREQQMYRFDYFPRATVTVQHRPTLARLAIDTVVQVY